MAKRKVVANRAGGIAEGETIEGFYLGNDLAGTRYGARKIHHIRVEGEDLPRKIWGTSNLNLILADVRDGALVAITMLPKAKGSNRHEYEVETDDSRVDKAGFIGRRNLPSVPASS